MSKDEKVREAATETMAGVPSTVEASTASGGTKTETVVPSSQIIGKGDKKRVIPKVVGVSNEKDMTAELILKGPVKRGPLNVYITKDGKKLKFDAKTGALLTLVLVALLGFGDTLRAQGPGRTGFLGPAFEAPLVTLAGVDSTHGPATGLKVNFTRGKLYIGSGAIAVTAGSVSSLTASKNNCDGPAYSSCDIIYADSSGTVAFTTAIGTAKATGNSVLAYVETGTASVTKIQQAFQDTRSDIPTTDSAAEEIRAYCTGTLGSAEAEFLNNAACSGSTTATSQRVISAAGTLKNLRVNLRTAVKSAASAVTATVYINGSPSTITCDVATATATCSDLTHTAAVAAGDIVDFKFATTNSSDTGANVGMVVQKY